MLSLTPLGIGIIVTLTVLAVAKPVDRIGLKGFVALVFSYFAIAALLTLLPLRLGFEKAIVEYPFVVIWIAIATAVNSMALVTCATERWLSQTA